MTIKGILLISPYDIPRVYAHTHARAPGRSLRDSLRIPVGLTTRTRIRARERAKAVWSGIMQNELSFR